MLILKDQSGNMCNKLYYNSHIINILVGMMSLIQDINMHDYQLLIHGLNYKLDHYLTELNNTYRY